MMLCQIQRNTQGWWKKKAEEMNQCLQRLTSSVSDAAGTSVLFRPDVQQLLPLSSHVNVLEWTHWARKLTDLQRHSASSLFTLHISLSPQWKQSAESATGQWWIHSCYLSADVTLNTESLCVDQHVSCFWNITWLNMEAVTKSQGLSGSITLISELWHRWNWSAV